ncbi:MAG: branched-chain amino acid aminotransferase [Saprospiraceae bacterium]|nr:branched-chain amino acid aminotransferase [Saprospiraceae bacterium]
MSQLVKFNSVSKSNVSNVDFNNIPFGKIFTDHMFVADYFDGQWCNFEICPVHKLEIHPGNLAWHYGQSIFEGMKASITKDRVPLLFRPEMHAKRLNFSARRMCMPEFPEDIFINAVHTLVNLEQNWIPPQKGSALYIRPFMIAMDEAIGVRASDTYKFIIFTMPVGPYYSKPVNLYAQDQYVRAVVGGVGEAKTAGNYAASLYPANIAKKEGYDQVMRLDGIHKKYVQEVGTMNIFFVINDEVITPNLDGAILSGITRDSVLKILKDQGNKIIERQISIDEIMEAGKNGQLKEVFGTGTAAVIAQVDKIKYKDQIVQLDPANWKYSTMLKNYINDLREGSVEDTYGWTVPARNAFNVTKQL